MCDNIKAAQAGAAGSTFMTHAGTEWRHVKFPCSLEVKFLQLRGGSTNRWLIRFSLKPRSAVKTTTTRVCSKLAWLAWSVEDNRRGQNDINTTTITITLGYTGPQWSRNRNHSGARHCTWPNLSPPPRETSMGEYSMRAINVKKCYLTVAYW